MQLEIHPTATPRSPQPTRHIAISHHRRISPHSRRNASYTVRYSRSASVQLARVADTQCLQAQYVTISSHRTARFDDGFQTTLPLLVCQLLLVHENIKARNPRVPFPSPQPHLLRTAEPPHYSTRCVFGPPTVSHAAPRATRSFCCPRDGALGPCPPGCRRPN